MRVACTALALASVLSICPPARAQTPLTLTEALARARQQSPRLVSARLAVDEARARLPAASLRLQSNPELDAGLGSRQGSGVRSTDIDIGVLQMFEPGGRRQARVDAVTAQVDQARAGADAAAREVLRDTAASFHRALYFTERIRLFTASEALASSIFTTADRRFRAGDIAVLDVNLARATLARARADRLAAEADLAQSLGELRALTGLDGDIAPQGKLAPPQPVDAATLASGLETRPELRELDAAIRAADREAALARSFGQPDYGVGFRYAREEDKNIFFGGVTLTLPLFAKGQEQLGTSAARASRLRAELDIARNRIRHELRVAVTVFEHRAAAVRALETDALPGLDDNEALSTRSFEVGQIGLADLLLIRREILDTRFQYLSTLLDATLARIEVDAAAMVLQ